MLWLALPGVPGLPLLAQGAADTVSSVDGAAGSIVTYLLGWGPLGIFLVALGWLLFKGWRLVSPEAAQAIREEGRADLVAERDRVITEKTSERDRLTADKREAERERDEAIRLRDETLRMLLPLMTNFTSSTQSLAPVLQNLTALLPAVLQALTGTRQPPGPGGGP